MSQRAAWNRFYERQEVESTSPAALLELHGVKRHLSTRAHFLDVGVGVGDMARYVSAYGATVDCLDVADRALEHVNGFIRAFYLDSEIEKLPRADYDLALAHLVAQHMTDEMLERNLRHVYRALKPSGVYSLQFAGDSEPSIPPSPEATGHVTRTVAEATALCERSCTGAEVRLLREPEHWPNVTTWYFYLHVVKQTAAP